MLCQESGSLISQCNRNGGVMAVMAGGRLEALPEPWYRRGQIRGTQRSMTSRVLHWERSYGSLAEIGSCLSSTSHGSRKWTHPFGWRRVGLMALAVAAAFAFPLPVPRSQQRT